MAKILIIQWIIMHCDLFSFKGMRWHKREEGIFWLYWKHQSSTSCKNNTDESSSLYEYYRAWARHKNNNRRRQPRDLKAAFRNALEKKPELERLKFMDTKEKIFWRIKDFPDGQQRAPKQPPVKKPRSPTNRGKKSSYNLVQNGGEFPVNFGASTSAVCQDDVNLGASTSNADEAVARKNSRKSHMKGNRKVSGKAKRSSVNEEDLSVDCEPTGNEFSTDHEEANNQLPPFERCFQRNDNNNSSWDDSLRNTDSNFSLQSPHFSDPPYERPKNEDMWTPPPSFYSNADRFSPSQLSSDPMEVSHTDIMDLFIPNQTTNYSFQPTPPQQPTDILFENITDADIMTIGKIINGEEPTILKYSFPFQPEEVPISQPHQTNTNMQSPVTSFYCSVPDLTSPTKSSNLQNSNCVLDSKTTLVNAFLCDQNQCSFDQVVPSYCEAFQTSQQVVNTSEIFVNDCFLYSPPPLTNPRLNSEEICHQQANTVSQSFEQCRYNDQVSQDDSGISDMEDFLESANKLLDDIDSKSDGQYSLIY